MIITTSRKPSQRTRSLVNDLARVFNFEILNRGKIPLSELIENKADMIIVEELKGNPGRLKIFNFENNKILSMNLSLKLQREVSGKVFKNSGKLSSKFDRNTENLKELFFEYLFKKLSNYEEESSDVVLTFKTVDESTFYIEVHKDSENLGPSLKIKTVKILDIE
ncbi:rRNA maturation protein [Methanococcus maripaludis]|uniref:Probable Brix domain-containing ribosomal biogenesis protein n=2 Tax=Methanococcus maripaludis TaxID=39152 RepID=A0A7J9PI35_METMI|nr:rRNA maturation protein [Methanococcus maripaludis]MBA2862416.1 U3 small nucleolar ribonucleoprotein IMP4 [Methanococcus maripaludis]